LSLFVFYDRERSFDKGKKKMKKFQLSPQSLPETEKEIAKKKETYHLQRRGGRNGFRQKPMKKPRLRLMRYSKEGI